MDLLNINESAVAYADAAPTNNPRLKRFDWDRQNLSVPVLNPQQLPQTLGIGETRTIFNGTRTTSIDGTTAFTVTLNTSDLTNTRYRFTYVSGTTPVFRTDRALTLSGILVTVTVNNNQTVNFTLGSGTGFSAVQAGDTLFLPNVNTGDAASPFNQLNAGFWTVQSKVSSTVIIATRPTPPVYPITAFSQVGTVSSPLAQFSAISETQTVTANSQFQAFSSTATQVQVGDKVDITAGFAVATQRTFSVDVITPTFFEVVSSSPIPLEVAIAPGVAGITIYNNAVRYLRVEGDQVSVVQVNGDVGNFQKIIPIAPADITQMGWYEIWGRVYSLTLVNKAQSVANFNIFTAG